MLLAIPLLLPPRHGVGQNSAAALSQQRAQLQSRIPGPSKDIMLQDLVIVGAGGFGKEVAWLVECINAAHPRWRLTGFLDDFAEQHSTRLGLPVLGPISLAASDSSIVDVVIAVGDPRARRRLTESLAAQGKRFPTLVHPGISIHASNRIGAGVVICAGTTITVETKIGDHSHLNLHCTIGHGAVIEDYCTLSPGVHLSGDVHLEPGAFLGTGVQTIRGVRIGRGSTLGAGATVVRDIEPAVVAVGCPARAIKQVADF
jgi:sugar O-acyltransferase (sialic acid O-acetyltransferase NeuD family)